jgi:bacillolysin
MAGRLCAALLFLFAAASLRAENPAKPIRANAIQQAGSASMTRSAATSRGTDLAQRVNAALSAAVSGAPVAQVVAASGSLQPSPLAQRIGRDVTMVIRPGVGTPMQIAGAALAEPAAVAVAGEDQSVSTARAFLQANRSIIGLENPDTELAVGQRFSDDLGFAHVKFEQRWRGLAVWPGELTVHLDRVGRVVLMNGAYVFTPKLATAAPIVSAEDAASLARASAPGLPAPASASELLVYAPMTRAPRLAWRVDVGHGTVDAASMMIDAINGSVLASIPLVMTENVAGTGRDLFGNVVALNVFRDGSTFGLLDTSKSMFKAGCNIVDLKQNCGAIYVFDSNHTPATSKPDPSTATTTLVTSASATSWLPADGVSASFNFSKVYDYYRQRFNRNSIDGNGGNILAITRLGITYQNAFWSSDVNGMYFGDADFYAGSLDVTAHEMTHGVISKSADLIYQDQSGALNEAMADIFGEMVENFVKGSNDWILGSQLHSPVRNMANPALFGDPAKMSQYVQTTADHGGVHTNSGIINKTFYLLAEGESGAIGRSDAERIFYRALTTYLTKSSNFLDARLAAIRSADDLFGAGSNQSQRTAQAFNGTEILPATPAPPQSTPPPVSASDSILFLARNGSNLLLSRRETGKDPAQGNFIFSRAADSEKISISGDGTLGIFVTADNDACFFKTDGSGSLSCLNLAGSIASVAMSRDTNVFAFVLLDGGERDNRITYVDLQLNTTNTFDLVSPATDAGTVSTVLFADTLEFTANRRFLIYDALNVVNKAGGGGKIGLWSISAIDLTGAQTYSIVPPVPGFDIFNPAVAKTSDSFITFEATHQSDSKVDLYTDNFMTGALKQVVVNVPSGLAVPGYTGDDRGIVYSYPDTTAATGRSLAFQALATDRLTPVGAPQGSYLFDGSFATIYRRGTYTGPTATCVQNATTLCLSSSRFQVTATFSTNEGQQGIAQAVRLTADTGYFTFFDPGNVEVVVKVLNTCSFAHNLWVFAGGLTNVAAVITVTDTLTGVSKTYANPQNTPFVPIQDTSAFNTCYASSIAASAGEAAPLDVAALAQSASEEVAMLAKGAVQPGLNGAPLESATACVADAQTLCLSNNRFQVRTTWRTDSGSTGTGKGVRLTADTGYFWFFDQSNVEVVVKVLNACSFNPNFWLFAGGLTDVQVTLTVTDMNNGTVKTYNNPVKTAFKPIQDTGAFPTCP